MKKYEKCSFKNNVKEEVIINIKCNFDWNLFQKSITI